MFNYQFAYYPKFPYKSIFETTIKKITILSYLKVIFSVIMFFGEFTAVSIQLPMGQQSPMVRGPPF